MKSSTSENYRVETNRCGAAKTWGRVERYVASTLVFVLALGLAGVLLGLVGWFEWWIVFPVTGIVWRRLDRMLPGYSSGRDVWWWAAVTFALILFVLNGLYPAEHVITGRDGGTYTATAGWLAHSRSLTIEARSDAFERFEALEYDVPGFYDRHETGMLEPQFMHAYPAVMGSVMDVGGLRPGLAVNSLFGSLVLLVVFALSRRYMAPWAALVVIGALGSSLVFIYYSRAPFSEMMMALFVIGGIWLFAIAEERADPNLGLIAGMTLGAATMVRLDGIVLLLPVFAYLWLRGLQEERVGLLCKRARIGLFSIAAFGFTESLLVSPAYILERKALVLPVLVALLGLMVSADLWGRQKRIHTGREVIRVRKTLFLVAVSVGGVLLAYGWLVRPLLVEATGGSYAITSIQESEGLEVEPGRTYAENSVRWLTWYQGPAFVIVAFVGWVVLGRRYASGDGARSGLLVVIVLTTFSVLYLWRPSINPDHIWVMRRYLTVVLPLGALLAGVGLHSLVERVSLHSGQSVKYAAGLVLSGLLVVPPVTTAIPHVDLAELSGMAGELQTVCDGTEPDDHVLFMGERTLAALSYAQSFRSFCGVKAARNGGQLDSSELSELNTAVRSSGGRLILAHEDETSPGELVFEGSYEYLELTLSEPPRDTQLLVQPLRLEIAPSTAES